MHNPFLDIFYERNMGDVTKYWKSTTVLLGNLFSLCWAWLIWCYSGVVSVSDPQSVCSLQQMAMNNQLKEIIIGVQQVFVAFCSIFIILPPIKQPYQTRK